jgi:hypothetical protein
MSEEEAILAALLGQYGSRWWYANEAVVDLPGSALPYCVGRAKLPRVSLGRWLANRRNTQVGDLFLEGKGATGETVRWRIVSDLL